MFLKSVRVASVFLAGAALHLAATSALAQTTVRMNGATTTEKMISPKTAEIEAKHNVKLTLVPNGAGRGLEDLVNGRADIAMTAGPVAGLAAVLNAKTPGAIKVEDLKEFVFAHVAVNLAVHPSNTVESITLDQARDLLSGKIKNWKEVGGSDTPVMIVIAQPLDGTRTAFQTEVMKDTPFAPDARVLQLATDLPKVTSQVPGAISVLSARNITKDIKALKTDKPVNMPVSLVTVGEPKDPAKAVITTIQAVCGDKPAEASVK